MGCSLTDPAGCLADLAGNAAGSIADSAFSDIAKDFGNAAGDAVNWLWGQISGATAVSLTGSAMTRDLAIVSTLAVVVATGLFLIQIIASVLRRDGSGLARAVKGLLVAFMGSVAAIAVTTLLLAAVDALSAGFVQAATGDSMSQMGTAILSATAITAATNPAIVLVLALIVLGAVIVVWGAMMVRKLLIIVTAVFAPLAFAGATADISTAWVRRWIETMVALIVSKLILVIIFVIGLGVLTDGLGESTGTGGASAIAVDHPGHHRGADPVDGRLRSVAGHQAGALRRRPLPSSPWPGPVPRWPARRASPPLRRRRKRWRGVLAAGGLGGSQRSWVEPRWTRTQLDRTRRDRAERVDV